MTEKTKKVEIQGHHFTIGLVPAHVGSWIITQIYAKTYSDFEVYQKIAGFLLDKVSLVRRLQDQSETALKIYSDGVYLVKEPDIEHDTDLYDELVKEALDFNVGPSLRRSIEKAEKEKERRAQSQNTSR